MSTELELFVSFVLHAAGFRSQTATVTIATHDATQISQMSPLNYEMKMHKKCALCDIYNLRKRQQASSKLLNNM